VADTEILAGMCDTLSALDVGPYKVKFSSRAVLDLLLEFAGIEGRRGPDVFRVLDKLPKIGAEKVRKELTTGYVDESGDPIKGLELSTGQVDLIERFLEIRPDDRRQTIAQLRELFAAVDAAAAQIDVVERISNHLYALGYADDRLALDLSIARGLAYYTGPVFEAELLDAPQFGSVFGGGRYDGLVERFLGRKIPATGASMGVDRLLAALDALGRLDHRKSTANVLVTVLDRSLMDDYVAITFALRRAGIAAELYLSDERIGKQLRYADACDIPVSLLLGSDEHAAGKVTLKDMRMGKARAEKVEDRSEWLEERVEQRQVAREDLVDAVAHMLSVIERRTENG
ncbi:MAG: histidine--tRNA ligase family protein, partial [Acidobacteriota bacterium]|nr:histidine--tRNA ligase family protein [Acidobacteriota bacterium]